MTRRAGQIAVFLALVVTPLLSAQIPIIPSVFPLPPRANSDEVSKLIAQLADADFQKRGEAAKLIERLGPSALPQLREALRNSEDPEVRRRLEEVIPRLEQAAALQPTLVTMSFRDLPVRKALQELARQSGGYKLELTPNTAPRSDQDPEKRLLSMDVRNMPFWQALDQLCDMGGLTYQEGWYGQDNETLRLEFGESHVGPTCFQGAFRITIRGFDYQRSLYFSQGMHRSGGDDAPFHRNETLRIEMYVSVEPRLPLAGTNNQVNFTEVVDDAGQSMMLPATEYNRYYFGGGMGRSFTQPVNAMLQPSATGKRIKLLKGSIPVTVVSAQKPKITVDKILEVKNRTYKEGTTTLTIDEVTKQGPQNIAIKLNINEPAGKKRGDPTWSYSLQSRFTLLDSKGNKYQSYGGGWNNSGNGSLQGTFHFGPPPGGQAVEEPAKLVFYEWTTVSHAVPFEFHDVPLP
jgi:hypothetical protein